MPIILDKVSHIYAKDTAMAVSALENVSLVIPDGQFIGLIGHTGSGKSTLVQHLNGLMKATSGSIYFNGEDVDGQGFDKRVLRSKVGLVFQYPEHQLFETDVFSDVCFGPKNLGLSKKEVELRAYEALKLVGLEDEYFYRPWHCCSAVLPPWLRRSNRENVRLMSIFINRHSICQEGKKGGLL